MEATIRATMLILGILMIVVFGLWAIAATFATLAELVGITPAVFILAGVGLLLVLLAIYFPEIG